MILVPAAERVFGVDYAWGRPGAAALKTAGAKFACRYLSHDTTGKNLTRAEADELSEAGIWLVVVWESVASRPLAGRDAGAADAQAAAAQAAACGMPDGRPIYFAADWDATAAQQAQINAYLDGAASVIGRDRVGLYGGHGPVKRAFDAGKITYGWQTYAWSGGRWDGRAQLQQYSNDHVINGVGVDYNHAMTSDYGQWRIGAAPGREDQEMPDYVSAGMDKAQDLPPGEWVTVNWGTEYADPAHHHWDKGGPSLIIGPALYALTCNVRIEGLPVGTELQARVIETAETGGGVENGPIAEYAATGGATFVHYSVAADAVREGYRARFQVIQYGTVTGRIVSGSAKGHAWRT